MKISKLILLLSFVSFHFSEAQLKITTGGTRSPIIHGASAKINYISKLEVKSNIPDALAPYIAGLLFVNKNIGSDTGSITKAFNAWANKYNELKSKILGETDQLKQHKAQILLDQGDFSGAEDILNISTSFRNLRNVFPETYRTEGNESPVIVGDYASVTYVVNQIVNYNLPENLTINLLEQLKIKDDTIKFKTAQYKQIQTSLLLRETAIKTWINRYRSIEFQLKSTPSSVSKLTLKLFEKGDFDSVLKILNRQVTNQKAFAENSILKAKILLIRLNYQNYDSLVNEINKAYAIAANLTPSYINLIEYGKFLIDYANDGQHAINALEGALDSAKNINQKLETSNYLALAYSVTDKVKANQILELALNSFSDVGPLNLDSTLLDYKATILYNIGVNYTSSAIKDTALFYKAINLTNQSIDILNSFRSKSDNLEYRIAVFQSSIGFYYSMLGDFSNAIFNLKKSTQFYENNLKKNSLLALPLANSYIWLGQLYANGSDKTISNIFLYKAIGTLQFVTDNKSSIFINRMEQIYTYFVRNFQAMGQIDSVLKYTLSFRDLLSPFANSGKDVYLFPLAEVNVDLGLVYISMWNFSDGLKALQYSYNYFIKHLSSTQFDKIKFSQCLASLNQYYIDSKNKEMGILFNREWLGEITKNESFNKVYYEDFEAQAYAQICNIFISAKDFDSAEFYCKKQLSISEIKAKQFPIDNIYAYSFSVNQLAHILLNKNRLDRLDSLANSLISNCMFMSNVNPWVNKNYQGVIGNCLVLFAETIYNWLDSSKTTSKLHAIDYFKIVNICFNSALSHLEATNLDTQNEFYLQYLFKRAIFESICENDSQSSEKGFHQSQKCTLLNQFKHRYEFAIETPLIANLNYTVNELIKSCN